MSDISKVSLYGTTYNIRDDTTRTYSTNEQAIGTWIDGKTIYRKVIHYSGEMKVGTRIGLIPTPSTVIQLYGFSYWDSVDQWRVTPTGNSILSGSCGFYIGYNSSSDYGIFIEGGSDWVTYNKNIYLIVEYTKR